MIEIFLIISVFLNIVILSVLYLSDNGDEWKFENQRLQMQNKILLKEYYKMKDLFVYLKNNDVEVNWNDDDVVIFYMPYDNHDEVFSEWEEEWI